MLFEPLEIPGAQRLRLSRHADERGFFARVYCNDEFSAHGLERTCVQASLSYNKKKGTVRGLHFQWPPSREAKLVRCIRGSIFDVLLDLRPDSPGFLRHVALQLDDVEKDAVYIPPGIAHGFQTLSDDTEVLYQMSDVFAPELSTGVLWNDSAFGIEWPLPVSLISERDAKAEPFDRDGFVSELRRRGAP